MCNSIKDEYVTMIRKGAIKNRNWLLLISVCWILFSLSDDKLSNINPGYISQHFSDNLPSLFISLFIFAAVAGPFIRMNYVIKCRLIKSIGNAPENKMEITTYNNEQHFFDRNSVPLFKEKKDWYLRYFVSDRNGIFNSLTIEQTKGLTLIIDNEKFYLIPGIFENNNFIFFTLENQ